MGVVDQAHLYILVYSIEKEIDKGRFAGTDFARNDDKTLVFRYGIFEMGVGVVMALAHEEIIRVGMEVKGFFF